MYSQQKNIYEMCICALIELQANSLSNSGNFGTNREYRRKQALSNGKVTDAFSGNINKHAFYALLRAIFIASGTELCPGCAKGSSLRIGALANHPKWNEIKLSRVIRCPLCDILGFLVTGKNETKEGSGDGRMGLWKSSLIEFSFWLALPGFFSQTEQVFTRSGGTKEEGQMLTYANVGSGVYAFVIRYLAVGIGADSRTGDLLLTDQDERIKRHRAILTVLKDQLEGPRGARTGTIFPQTTGLKGAISISQDRGSEILLERAPAWSPLSENFMDTMKKLVRNKEDYFAFNNVTEFDSIMKMLISSSEPAIPQPIKIGDWFSNE